MAAAAPWLSSLTVSSNAPVGGVPHQHQQQLQLWMQALQASAALCPLPVAAAGGRRDWSAGCAGSGWGLGGGGVRDGGCRLGHGAGGAQLEAAAGGAGNGAQEVWRTRGECGGPSLWELNAGAGAGAGLGYVWLHLDVVEPQRNERLWRQQQQGLPRERGGHADPGTAASPSPSSSSSTELEAGVAWLERLAQRGRPLTESLVYRTLKRCVAEQDVARGARVHAAVVAAAGGGGGHYSAFIGNQLICMYAGLGSVDEAAAVVAAAAAPDCYMWTSVILAHARHGRAGEAVALYGRMRAAAAAGAGTRPNARVWVAALKACAAVEDLAAGRQVHADITESAGEDELRGVFVATGLVDMYAKCGAVEEARAVFDASPVRDVALWNAMIGGYARHAMAREAVALFQDMQGEHDGGNHVTVACAVHACAGAGALRDGRALHALAARRGLLPHALVGNALVDMYAKCGDLPAARAVYDAMPARTVASRNAMMAGYVRHGRGGDALALYATDTAAADRVTYLCVLQACAAAGALTLGRAVHARLRSEQDGRRLDTSDAVVATALVHMYAQCGAMAAAQRALAALPAPLRTVATWTALLAGHARAGAGAAAAGCFRAMLAHGVAPDAAAVQCLMLACSRAGMLALGRRVYATMHARHGVVPAESHRNAMVDMLARAGRLGEAERIVRADAPGSVVAWTALLAGCKARGDLPRGRRALAALRALDPLNSAPYVLARGMLAAAGRRQEARSVERARRVVGARTVPARACIEVAGAVREFVVGRAGSGAEGGRTNHRSEAAGKARRVGEAVKWHGRHVPHTEQVMLRGGGDGADQENQDQQRQRQRQGNEEAALCGHAEKLALAYGLLHTPDGAPLLVTKNLRMCADCHSSTKVVAHMERRLIVVRDAHRVHRFQDGTCSCGDRI